MQENSVEIDENSPEYKEKLRILSGLDEKSAKAFACWQDMYEHLKAMTYAYMESPSKGLADFVLLNYLAFILAMENMPDEGDIVKIAKKMNEIFVMRPDLIGVEIFSGSPEEEKEAKDAAEVLNTLRNLAETLTKLPPPEEESQTTPRTLH